MKIKQYLKKFSHLKTPFVLPDLCNVQSVLVMIITTELLVVLLVLAETTVTGYSWKKLALLSLFVQWIVLTSAGLICSFRPYFNRLNLLPVVVFCYGIVLFTTFIISLIASWVLSGAPFDLAQVSVDGSRVLSNLIMSVIITGLTLRYFYVQQQLRQQEQSELQARIQALHSRIRPHFLFNSMNIIASLIEGDPETAETVIEDLSELFRASLNEETLQVSIDEEIDLCKRYVRIESLRLGERLSVIWDIDENLPLDLKIPMLTIQPLLENAIYHGIQPLPKGGRITIKLYVKDRRFYFFMANPILRTTPGVPSIKTTIKNNRMALQNIRYRLDAYYGQQASINTTEQDGLFLTEFSYPYHPHDSEQFLH